MRALSKDPADRFTSARHFREVLEELSIARTHGSSAKAGRAQVCGECGHVGPSDARRCDACGAAFRQRGVGEGTDSLLQRCDAVVGFDVDEPTDLDPREFELSPTTTTRAYRSVNLDLPLIGRQHELRRCVEFLEQESHGQQNCFLRITGAPGIG